MTSRICLLTFLLLAISQTAGAQASDDMSCRFDAGASIGISGYRGDANNANFLKRPGFGGSASMRYLPNSRMAVRAVLAAASLSGNTADWDNILPGGENHSFKATNVDFSVRYEFNFMPYGVGETYKNLRRWTPYAVAGLGVNLALCDGRHSVAPSLPLGVGVKLKLRPRVNLSAELTFTKVFGDNVDGRQLSDLYGIKSSFVKNTDWVLMLSVGVSFEFSPRCVTCHYVE